MTRLVAAGLSYRTAPLEVRERAIGAIAESGQLLRYLVGHAGLAGAAVLSTCNRTEFYLSCPDQAVADQVVPRLERYLDPSPSSRVGEHLESATDEGAIRRMFRVASGLESMVLGEAQVLGQFKAAHELALTSGTLDDRLGYVMRRAITVGKRVRTETAVGRGVGSLSEAAVLWASRRLGDLRGRGVLLVGAGTMSALAARRLTVLGTTLFVSSREGESASALAGTLGGRAVSATELESIADEIDLIISSTDSPSVVLGRADLEALQRRRRGRPLAVVDIAVPRDVDPSARRVPGVELIDLDQLGEHVERDMEGRRSCLPEADRIIDEEVAHAMAAVGQRDAIRPAIADLTSRADSIRRHELARALARLPALEEPERRAVEQLTRSLVRKLLHDPIAHLRRSSGDLGVVLTLRDAFGLDEDPAPE